MSEKSELWPALYTMLSGWEFLTAGEASEWLGVDRRKILFYVENGIVEPAVRSPGSGRRRMFTVVDLLLFKLFHQLDRMGIAPRCLRSMASATSGIVRCPPEAIGNRPDYLVVRTASEGKDSLTVTAVRGDDPGELLGSCACVFVNLRLLESEVAAVFVGRIASSEPGLALLQELGKGGDTG
jgi:hypothetical protein